MSTYYSYYLTKKVDGLLYFMGPFDRDHKPKPVIEDSRSYASDLYKEFYNIEKSELSDEVKKEFGLMKDQEEQEDIYYGGLMYMPMSKIPMGSLVKTGYVLISEVNERNNDVAAWEDNGGFSSILSPEVYAGMLIAEHTSDTVKEKSYVNRYGDTIQVSSASDYMWYAWSETIANEEYDEYIIHQIFCMMQDYKDKRGTEYGVLCLIR